MSASRINSAETRVAVASKINEFFQNARSQQVANLLMDNSLCSLRATLSSYLQPDHTNSNYKYYVKHLSQAFELMLNTCVARIDKKFIVRKWKKGHISKTMGLMESVNELKPHGIVIEENHLQGITDLGQIKNDIQHFGLLGMKGPRDALLSFCGSVYWAFLIKTLDRYCMRPTLSAEQFQLLMAWDDHWHFAKMEAAKVMYKWQQTLPVEQTQFEINVCPECCTLSLIKDNLRRITHCRCCGHNM